MEEEPHAADRLYRQSANQSWNRRQLQADQDSGPAVVVVGAGWAGCAAALAAAQAGARVTLLERTDMILGTGLVGGIMNNNGRLTALEEIRLLGGEELMASLESEFIHRNVALPGHEHAALYDVRFIEPTIRRLVESKGIQLMVRSRCVKASVEGTRVRSVSTDSGVTIPADCFVDATGTAGPQRNCAKHRSGCVMCVLRCPTFGPRVSLAGLAGVNEETGVITASTSGSCKIPLDSLGDHLADELRSRGVTRVPLPAGIEMKVDLSAKSCRQYDDEEFKRSLIALHTGHAKLMVPFMPLEKLRTIPGFERARYVDPYSGGVGNSVRYTLVTPHDPTLRVSGTANLFCAGEKAGLMVGHTEAIATGMLAGHNAVRTAIGLEPVVLPRSLMVGDFLRYVESSLRTEEGMKGKYTFSGSIYFRHALEEGLYTTDRRAIQHRVSTSGLEGVFSTRLC